MNTKRNVGLILVVAIVGALVFAGVNVGRFAPFGLLLLVCPLMMFFMMRSMNHGGTDNGGTDNGGQERSTRAESAPSVHPGHEDPAIPAAFNARRAPRRP